MTANGFKSPAPVLPAMGLHSFHNDSPPFGAAATEPHDPEYFSLDLPSRGHTTSSSATSPSSSIPPPMQPIHPTTAMPIPQRGFNPILSRAPPSDQSPDHDQERHPETEDDRLSSSRSRRLVSGYMFGNPPSPVGRRHIPRTDRVPTPPTADHDSPPLSEVGANDPFHVSLQRQMAAVDLNDSVDEGESTLDLMRQVSSKSRDRDTGYDALAGYNDGEADLDLDAPPPDTRGTKAYLQGAKGEAGEYRFPRHRLRTKMKDESKIPLVIVACGSFSPPTYLHLRMFEMAKDEILESGTYEIMAGYYSPVSSYYKKAGLAPAIHRVRMCELGVEHTSTWLMVDPWEAGQPEYQRTAVVLEHFDEMLNGDGGMRMSDGKKRRFKIMLLAGGDLIESFGEPGVWSEPDLHIILGRFGCLIVERAGSDVWAFLLSHDILYHHRRNVIVIKQLIYNDISSTKVRLFVRRGMSIKYLLPNSVIQYIYDNRLYRFEMPKAVKSG